jgi:two-component system sensor histidine kinase KdpD
MATLNRTAGTRILGELVENALAFSPADRPVVIRVSDDDGRIEIRVVDEGPGVDADAAERIFEPLEQGEDLYTRTHQGVGLGLSLARLSARAMDGDVALEDGAAPGATFLWTVARPEATAPLR